MRIDANANVGPTLWGDFEFEPTLAELRSRLSALDVDGAVVAPLKPHSYDFDEANEQLADRLADVDHYYGLGRIDPRRDDAVERAERALTDYGLVGLKLHPWEETYPLSADIVPPIIDVADDHSVPMWLHAGYPNVSHALSVRRLAQSYPDTPFVLTHSSQLDISGGSLEDVKLMARETGNTYFELSGIYRHDFIQDIIEEVGPERVLFGTNAPYYNPRLEISRVTMAHITDKEKEMLLGESIRTLLP